MSDRAPGRERMKPQDGMWLQDTPQNLMVINSVFTLDTIDVETLRRLWQERVIGAGGGRRFPRFTRKVVKDGRLWWEEDSGFDLAAHVFETPGAEHIDSREKLQELVGELASKPLPRERPLWQLQLIPRLSDGLSAIVFRVHHCMGDGIAMVPVLFSLMDRDDPAIDAFVEPQVKVGAGNSGRSKVAVGLAAAAVAPFKLLGLAAAPRDDSPLHGPECSGTKRVAWTDPIDLAMIKDVKNTLGATVNDVLMACVAGAFQRYARANGGEPLSRLRVSMPVNVRWPDEPPAMDNRFATVLLKLPAHLSDVRERVKATKKRMDRLKRSPEPVVMFGAQNILLYTLPSKLGRKLVNFYGNKTTSVLTNVPGPQVPLFVGGSRVRGLVFWVPQRDRIGIGISIISFSGAVRVGVIGDTALLEDPGALVAAFEEEFGELRGAVAGPPA